MTAALPKLINKYKEISQLKKNVLSGGGSSILNIAVTLVSYPIYLGFLGVSMYGVWAALSVLMNLSQLGELMMSTAVTKLVASEYGKKNYKAVTEYITTSLYLLLIPAMIIMVIVLIFSRQIGEFMRIKEVFHGHSEWLIISIGFLSVFSFFVNAVKGAIIGIGRLDIANYVLVASRVLQLVFAAVLLMLGFGVWSLCFGYFLYSISSLLIWIFILHAHCKINIFSLTAFHKNKAKDLIKLGGTLFTGTLAQFFFVPFNKIIVARYIGLAEVTYYEIAVKCAMMLRSVFVQGLEAILPKISEIHAAVTDKFKHIFTIYRKSMIYLLVCALPVYAIVFIFARPILEAWLNVRFDIQMVTILKILLVSRFINALMTPDYYMFIGIGKAGHSVVATFLKSIVNVFLVTVLLLGNSQLTLTRIAYVDCISVAAAFIFLKYKFFEFKSHQTGVLQCQ